MSPAPQSSKPQEILGEGVCRQALVHAYKRRPGDPVTRPLRVYTTDSTTSSSDGSVASVEVPWEPLAPGPEGAFLKVDVGENNWGVDLDNPRILIRGGLDPSVSDILFHQQMIYAVSSKVYAQFRRALGRLVAWGFDGGKLRLVPHAESLENAFYDPENGVIQFGCFSARQTGSRVRPPGKIYTCLSHDIVVHEFTHALVGGLRSRFTVPTSNDVLGFHEGFADLIALFQHFTYKDVIEIAIRQSDANLQNCYGFISIGRQFGEVTSGGPLRCAIADKEVRYSPDLEPHDMGSILLAAVFTAFMDVYKRKIGQFIAMAYRPPSGYMTSELVTFLAHKASDLASQFLNMCIRALDYCPPVDLQLGEYLRALITADRELIPADTWGYRDALIGAFAARGIYPTGVDHLSEDALVWRPPARPLGAVNALHFANLRFAGDPSLPASEDELRRQATALWAYVTQPHLMDEFGLAPQSDDVKLPRVESIRTSRRVGLDGQVLFDQVAEVTQLRWATDPDSGLRTKFYGGSTIIIGPEGEIRYVISKNVNHAGRLAEQIKYQRSHTEYWNVDNEAGRFRMKGYAHQLAHNHPRGV